MYIDEMDTSGSVCVVLMYSLEKRATDIVGVYVDYLTATKRVRELRECHAIPTDAIVTLHTELVWGYV